MSNLIDTLKQVPDFLNAHGRSYPLWILLLLTTLIASLAIRVAVR